MDNGPIDWGSLFIGVVVLALFAVVLFWVALEIRDRSRRVREQRGDAYRQQAHDEMYDVAADAWESGQQGARLR